MTRYDLAYLAAAPLLAPAIVWKRFAKGKYRESLPGQFGRGWAADAADPRWRGGCLWVHAVSVGEVGAAKAMLPLLAEAYPTLPRLLTTTTETGQAAAKRLEGGLADAVLFFPADFSWVVDRFLATYRPRALMLMETELWPNVLTRTAATGAPVITLNGKISPKAFRGYMRLGALARVPLSSATACCMQTQADAARIIALGVAPERVAVTGNCKFDLAAPALAPGRADELRAMLGFRPDQPLVVAGSTHTGEEELLIDRFTRDVLPTVPTAGLVLVPRHPERFGEVWDLIEGKCGAAAWDGGPARWSGRRLGDGAVAGSGPVAVALADRMGLLAELYAVAAVGVVAGSLLPGVGGHNILEPALHGVPAVYGPHMEGQAEMTAILHEGTGATVTDGERIGAALADLLSNPSEAVRRGAAGRAAVERNRGAARRNLDVITRILTPAALEASGPAPATVGGA